MDYSFKNVDPSIYSQLFQVIMNGVNSISDVEGLELEFLMQPHPVTNDTNSLGLKRYETDLVLVTIAAAYNSVTEDGRIQAAVEDLLGQHVHILQEAGLWVNFTYLNYAGSNQNPIATYGTMPALRKVSKKYDPKGVFQTAVPGPWKLF